jgi:RNA 3'-terminal phosphate cyclase-like protein
MRPVRSRAWAASPCCLASDAPALLRLQNFKSPMPLHAGTTLRYRPGFIHGGAGLEHDCGTSRAMGYFLEPILCLALFGRKPLFITLRGITNDDVDPGIGVFRTVTLPLLRQISGLEDGFELRVVRRGATPGGGGEIALRCPTPRTLPPVSVVDEGMVKRVRGVAYSMRVAPQTTNRMVDGARGVLNDLLADVYIFTDHMSGRDAGNSPGFGLTLVAETTSGRMIAAEAACAAVGGGETAEDVGRRAARALFEEVGRGGVVDGAHQGLLLLLCALGPEEVNEVRLGPLTPHAVRTLRHVKEFFGVQFGIRPERDSRTIFLTCVGAGTKNMGKKIV